MRWSLPRTAAALAGFTLLLALAARAGSPTTGGGRDDEPAEPLPTTGKADPDLAPFDEAVEKVLREHHVPGAALAVARDGKVVYRRGFGYADREAKAPVEPDSLFRIASLSKSITAAAVLQLVEHGKLRLDDKVFEVLVLQAPDDPDAHFDERWKDVTISHLLHHRGGWDRDKSFDPMFHSGPIVRELKIEPPADADAIVRYMLRRPLDFTPGARYVYSNFGYCLLGRVIEKVTGERYEDYVKKEVLAPLGIERMRQGRTLLKDRAPGEVKYYADGTGWAVLGPDLGKRVPMPYGGWCLESLDSVGAWIASAHDLVRFADAFDDPKHCKILDEDDVHTLFGPPPESNSRRRTGTYYGCGWLVRPLDGDKYDAWHDGALAGTSTFLMRRHDGLTWAVLFNSEEEAKGHSPADAADALLRDAADEVKHWPRGE